MIVNNENNMNRTPVAPDNNGNTFVATSIAIDPNHQTADTMAIACSTKSHHHRIDRIISNPDANENLCRHNTTADCDHCTTCSVHRSNLDSDNNNNNDQSLIVLSCLIIKTTFKTSKMIKNNEQQSNATTEQQQRNHHSTSINERTIKFAQSIKTLIANIMNQTQHNKTDTNRMRPTLCAHCIDDSIGSKNHLIDVHRMDQNNGQNISSNATLLDDNNNNLPADQNDEQLDPNCQHGFDWPQSFIQLLDSLANKQKQQQNSNAQNDRIIDSLDGEHNSTSPIRNINAPVDVDATCSLSNDVLTIASPSISSMAIDDRDFELIALPEKSVERTPQTNGQNTFAAVDDNVHSVPNQSNLANNETLENRSLWLMDFTLADTKCDNLTNKQSDGNDAKTTTLQQIRNPIDTNDLNDENDRNIMNLMKFLCEKLDSRLMCADDIYHTTSTKPTKRKRFSRNHEHRKTFPIQTFNRITVIDFNQLNHQTTGKQITDDTETNVRRQPPIKCESFATQTIVQDFDDEDDDEGDVVENTVDHAEDGSTTVGRQTEVKSMDERCRLASSMNERDSSHSSSGSYHSQRPKGESENSDGCASSGPRDDGKYSMLQFALHNFQEALEKYPLGARPVSKSGAHQASNNDDMNTKPSNNHNDTSTLRGSLKLIERLRGNSCAGSHQVNSSRDSSSDWTWRELADMVKFTRIPIRRSLLRLQQGVSSANDAELERKACECFVAIMQFMGDLNKSTKLPPNVLPCNNEVECVYLLLINLHNCLILRNEVYCQLIKQTTNNRSDQPDSCLRGWRLFSIVAAYFDCSPEFKPYLLKHLEGAAYDKRRAYSQVASICLQNLRKTLKYGGRKNVPSIEEIAATSAGRNSKRQIYRLPGGTERVINTKSTTVVDDIIHEICSQMLNVTDLDEMREFSLYCIADLDDDDGTNVDSSGRDQVQQQHCATMPLNGDEYILDITTELIKSHRQYFLIFCRSIWHYPLRLDSKLYIEVIFNQIAPDYLEGLLLVMSSGSLQFSSAHRKTRSSSSSSMSSSSTGGRTSNGGHGLRLKGKVVREIARLAALLQRASGSDREPQQEELRYLLPKPVVASMRRGDIGFDVVDSSEDNYATQSDLQATASTDGQRPNWLELVQRYWHEMSAFDTLDAKAQFLDIVRHWPLFGSSFFAIKLIQRDLIQPIDYILALNKLGIQMLDQLTHETMHCYAFNEVVSTRKVRSEDGALFLDLKCGNLIKRTIVRIQTDQAHEINRLIKQYIEIDLRRHQQQQQQHQQPVTSSQNDARNQL